MAITVKKRANISKEFVERYREAIEMSLEETKTLIEQSRGTGQYEKNVGRARKLHRVLHGPKDERGSIGHEITRLRSLPFVKYEVKEAGGITWMCGVSNDIIMTGNRDAGPYVIAFNVTNGSDFHLIPTRDPRTAYRTAHHRATPNSELSPLEFPKSTCQGSFGTVLRLTARNGEYAELFRSLYKFTETYNSRSPLISISNCTHIRQL